jgi:hypothetical protein
MLHVLAILGAVVWFGLDGLLWYARPSDLVWLIGSAILGMIFFAGFFFYLGLADRSTKTQIEINTSEDSD